MDVNDPEYKLPVYNPSTTVTIVDVEPGSDEILDTLSGPDFASFAKQLMYDKSKDFATSTDFYYPYVPSNTARSTTRDIISRSPIPADAFALYGNSVFASARKESTTLFMIDSKNRDKQAFPQPTAFTLKPPRVYKNVVQLQLSQLKLLTSFYYFSARKGNITLPVRELGRDTITSMNGKFLTEAVIIPEGTYDIVTLLAQIQLQMNKTPIFYNFSNGYNDFIERFPATGDLSINFNSPGDTYYDSLNARFITNPTITQIVLFYWPSQYSGLSSYTQDQLLCAYYFPVLYELVNDPTNKTVYPYMNWVLPNTIQPLVDTFRESVMNYVKYNSSGLSDPVIAQLIKQNTEYLDIYRSENTFQYSLVNRYQATYDSINNIVNIFTTSLNTSLVNLIKNTNSSNTAATLTSFGLTTASYSNLNAIFGKATAVFNGMYNFIQSQFGTHFAVNYAKYSSQFFLTSSNVVYIQNGRDATGVTTSYTTQLLASGVIPISSSAPNYSNSPGYWPNLTPSMASHTFANSVAPSMTPYDVASSNFLYNASVIDENSNINVDKSTRTITSLITVNPARYTIFKFRSDVRQTLQVETLPIPYYYRFSDYNALPQFPSPLPGNPQKYFDVSYNFVYTEENSNMDNTNYMPIQLPASFDTSLTPTTPTIYSFTSISNIAQFEFIAPYPSTLTSGLVAYNTSFAFISMNPTTNVSTVWASSIQSYIYHDRAAFMADLITSRNENSNHYIASLTSQTNSSDITFNFSTFAGNTYYAIVRSTDPICQKLISYSPRISYPISTFVQVQTDYTKFNPFENPYTVSSLSNYPTVINYNTDFTRLPVASSLWGLDPRSPEYLNQVRVLKKPIGYDLSGVSNNLTDYYTYQQGIPGFVPQAMSLTTTAIDPLTQYKFKNNSPFNSNVNSYFGIGSSNLVLQPSNQTYTFKMVSTSQTTIVHWYDGYSIPIQKNDTPTGSMPLTISSSVTSSIAEYLQGFNTTTSDTLQFGDGITAIGFIPTDGLYSVNSFSFKSILYPLYSPSTIEDDPNAKIAYVGVFKGATLASSAPSMPNALILLSSSRSVVYSPLTQSNTPGFGVEYGTWYSFTADPTFSTTTSISGYTQGSNELLSYTSMYYMVPFDSTGTPLTYVQLAGSILPYPLSQVVSTGSTYFGKTVLQPTGVTPQLNYCMPSTVAGANLLYGPQNGYSYTQSQYQQSQPITTTSLGYQDTGLLVRNDDTLYSFTTIFSTPSYAILDYMSVGVTTHFSEYTNSLYLVNSMNYMSSFSNSRVSLPGAAYASSISTAINTYNGTRDCIQYLYSTPSTLQSYTYTALSSYSSTFTFNIQPGSNTSTTIQSFQLHPSTLTATVWMWGGGGAAVSSSQTYGGAGAYVKANIDVQMLYKSYGISTLYMVVGKGGNTTNFSNTVTAGKTQGYEQLRYGGGGTSILPTSSATPDRIAIQGGGFSGIFMTSTLSSPIVLVGGGGAAGPQTFGGPGGFGVMPLPSKYYQFSTVTLNTKSLATIPVSTIYDIDSNSFSTGYPVTSTIDGNLGTYWRPTGAYMNSGNLNPAINVSTYCLNLSFNTNLPLVNTVRLYASMITGVTIYANSNKIQQLYSNTSIRYSNLYGNQVVDFTPISQISTSILTTTGWIVGGTATASTSMLQYSIDGSNWAQMTNVGYSLPANSVMSVLYASAFAKWFACAQRDIFGGTAGTGFRISNISTEYTSASFSYIGPIFASLAVTTSPAKTLASIVLPPNYVKSQSINITVQFQATRTQSSLDTSITYSVVNITTSITLYTRNFVRGAFTNSSISLTNTFSTTGCSPNDILEARVVTGRSSTITNTTTSLTFSYLMAPIVAVSGNNQYMISLLKNISYSNTKGSSWVPLTDSTPTNIYAVAINADGKYIAVCSGGYTYISYRSSPETISPRFTQVLITSIPLSTKIQYIAMSETGKYMVVTSNFTIYTSSNHGSTWTAVLTSSPSTASINSTMWGSISISPTGQYMLATQVYGTIYMSSNYGSSFTPLAIPGISTSTIYASAISENGQYMIVALISGAVYLSSAYGISWTKVSSLPSSAWTSVSMSVTGQYITLGGLNVNVWTSSSYGRVWASNTSVINVLSVSMGINGEYQLATGNTSSDGNSKTYLSIATTARATTSPILQSSDGLNWTPTTVTTSQGYYTLAYRSALPTPTVVAGGLVGTPTGNTGVIYTTNGTNWSNATTMPFTVEVSRIRYINGNFWGMSITDPGLITSSDGSQWALVTGTAGFNAVDIAFGNSWYVVAQSGISDGPYQNKIIYSSDANTWYQSATPNSNTIINTVAFGNNVFVAGGSTTDGSSCILYGSNGQSWTKSQYSNVGNQTINEIQFLNGKFVAVGQFPLATGNAVNQRSILTSSDGIEWTPSISGGFNSDTGNFATSVGYGNLEIVPNLSTLYMEFKSAARPFIYEIQPITLSSIGSQTVRNSLSTIIDNSRTTSYWPSEAQTNGMTEYSMSFQYSTLTTINSIEFYLPSSLISPVTPPAYFTGLTIQGLYSNTAISSNAFVKQNSGDYLFTALLLSTVVISSLQIDLLKTTRSSIQLSEVKATYEASIGISSMSGYSGGLATTMTQSFISYEYYTGGAGTITNGGVGLAGGLNGGYLYGGSPGDAGNQKTALNFSTIVNGAGGGGGGYYGGGGGGSTITGVGGAGGGGAGYYTTASNLVTILKYGTATPSMNYVSQGSNDQISIFSNSGNILYGQGGSGTKFNGQGGHGCIYIECSIPGRVDPIHSSVAFPSFIDGSKLSLLQAEIPITNNRVLTFASYTDSLQSSVYSNTNWVWYRSYLSLTGGTLLPSMTASIDTPSFPSVEYPYIPNLVYTIISEEFNTVSTFFSGDMSVSTTITNTMEFGFNLLEGFFVSVPYYDPSYVQMTELYCLLDYLRDPLNLIYPHVNPHRPRLDRVFGGLPRFGYWANPFLTNVSYLGFDMGPSLPATPALYQVTGSSNSVTAMYGLVLEQSLSTGIYELKDIMAYKATVAEAQAANSMQWLVASQFTESYSVRSLSNAYIKNNIPVQPYSFAAGIEGHLPLVKYSVHSVNRKPIHVINDFQGATLFAYSFEEESVRLTSIPFTSTIVEMNQIKIAGLSNQPGNCIGTAVSEYSGGVTSTLQVTQFALNHNSYPIVTFNTGPSNIYNSYTPGSQLTSPAVGKAIFDYNGNLYATQSNSQTLYQNVCTNKVYMQAFKKTSIPYVSPKTVLSQYIAGVQQPYYDFFMSKYTNIWHVQGSQNMSSLYGVRLGSRYDTSVTTNFVNQVYYPTHKITLTQNAALENPMTNGTYLTTYPSYQRTQMFLYSNYTALENDISGQFAQESSSNFQYMDSNSGFFLTSYINNISLNPSPANTANLDSYNYLAIRAYSPSERFQSLVRFYLPGRYDFGYLSLADLSNEIITLQGNPSVNPDYITALSTFNSSFKLTNTYGASGYPGYSGSTITTLGFGDFLKTYKNLYTIVSEAGGTISTVNGKIANGFSNLINGDLSRILPPYVATRSRVTDPLEFSLPFSSIVSYSNSGCTSGSNLNGQYGLGFNLGYAQVDTGYTTVQRAGSFFKVLVEDYIYLKMNPEQSMNRLDISRQENFAVTHDTTAEPNLYNCKLILNSFGTYSTTFIQNPVYFNPPIGKLDKLIFSWYDNNGNIIDNSECEWTATIQIVELSDVATSDSTAPRPL